MDDIARFARKLNPTYPLFHVAAPYPGTKMYEEALKGSSHPFSDDTLFPEAYRGAFSVEELNKMTRSAYLHFYTSPNYLWSRLSKGEFRALGNQLGLFWQFVRT